MNDALQIKHPEYHEAKVFREARVLRALRLFLEWNGKELDDTTRAKLHKTINLRLLTIMNEVRDAASK